MANEQWFAIVDDATGELVSVGTVVAEKLSARLKALPLTEQPDFGKVRWDAASRTLKPTPEPPPPESQLDRIEAKLNALLSRLP